MKFTPRVDEENVNVSKTPALKELVLLLTSILGILLAIYVLLGLGVEIVARKIPPRIEKNLASFYLKLYRVDQLSAAKKELQDILDNLVGHLPDSELEFRVYLVKNDTVNALALPGGNIVVFSGLLEAVQSENELAMVLAHELGHFANRDHLRGLGRSLVFVVLSAVVFGQDSSATQFLQNVLLTTEFKFSRSQEAAADLFGLELLNSAYGHVAGATDFFKRLHDEQKMPRFLYFFATHPAYENRIESLDRRIAAAGYVRGERRALNLQ